MKSSPSIHLPQMPISTPPLRDSTETHSLTGYEFNRNMGFPSSLCGSATIAEAGEGCILPGGGRAAAPDYLKNFYGAETAAGIEPVGGWVLRFVDKPTNDGFTRRQWLAQRDGVSVLLRASPTRWTPSQDRFAWLVDNAFPVPAIGVWDDTSIERAMGRAA